MKGSNGGACFDNPAKVKGLPRTAPYNRSVGLLDAKRCVQSTVLTLW